MAFLQTGMLNGPLLKQYNWDGAGGAEVLPIPTDWTPEFLARNEITLDQILITVVQGTQTAGPQGVMVTPFGTPQTGWTITGEAGEQFRVTLQIPHTIIR